MTNIIGAQCKIGQLKNGVNLAPLVMKEYLQTSFKDKFTYSQVRIENTKDYYQLMNHHKSISNPVTIGGDHSIALSTIGSSLQKHKNLKVLWLDAHADINTPESSHSKSLHGMPVSTLLGTSNIIDLPVKLQRENLTYIGLRDIDQYEYQELESIKWYSSRCVYKHGPSKILKELDYSIQDPIHLSLDVDVLDPRHFPSTGTAVPHGIQPHHVFKIIDTLKHKIVSLDIVEYNPLINDNPKCKDFIAECIKRLHL